MDAVDRSELEMLRLATSGKLDRLNDKVEALTREVARYSEDHEKRVRALEKWKYAVPVSSLLVLAAFLGGRVL